MTPLEIGIELLNLMLNKTEVQLTDDAYNQAKDGLTYLTPEMKYIIIRITEDLNADLYNSENDIVLHDMHRSLFNF